MWFSPPSNLAHLSISDHGFNWLVLIVSGLSPYLQTPQWSRPSLCDHVTWLVLIVSGSSPYLQTPQWSRPSLCDHVTWLVLIVSGSSVMIRSFVHPESKQSSFKHSSTGDIQTSTPTELSI